MVNNGGTEDRIPSVVNNGSTEDRIPSVGQQWWYNKTISYCCYCCRTTEGGTRYSQVDPNCLIKKEGCLGYEKSSGFEAVTNFLVTIGGYIVDDFEHVSKTHQTHVS